MADKTFHSIKFPGLPDTYKIPYIVNEYSTSSAYAVGDYVLNDGKTYKCTTAIASSGEAWNTAHWTEVKVGNDLQGEVANLTSALFNTVITQRDPFDWSELGDSNYALGWRTGYYDRSTGDYVTSNNYIRTNPTKFFEPNGCSCFIIEAPSGYQVKVYEYQSNESFVGSSPTWASSQVVSHVNTHKYHFALNNFSGDAANYCSDLTFLNSIILRTYAPTVDKLLTSENVPADAKATGYQIQELNESISTTQVDIPFKTNSTYPTGWRKGYFSGDIGESYSGTSSDSYIRIHFSLNSDSYPSLFNELIKISITPPTGYACRIIEANSSNEIIQQVGAINTNTYPSEIGKTQTIDIDHDNRYVFDLGRFNNSDASSYLTESFISQIKFVGLINKTEKKRKTGTYEFFNVSVDRPLSFGGEETITETQSVECVLRLPDTYIPSGTPTRLVLACHGASGYIDSANNKWYNTYWKDFMDYILSQGYAVFDANVLPTTTGVDQMGFTCGSPLYVNVLKKAYDYITQNYNVYERIFAHGTSMGGCGASNFVNAFPELVIAESSFAGRDFLQYIAQVADNTIPEEFSISLGYESISDLNTDCFSHAIGLSPSLSILKYNNGTLIYPPDRETDYSNWLAYYGEIYNYTKNDAIGQYTAKRIVPYKAWDSWGDNVNKTKAKLILQRAFTNGNSSPFYCVVYDEATHTELSYGQVNNMREQLIAWFKRWE